MRRIEPLAFICAVNPEALLRFRGLIGDGLGFMRAMALVSAVTGAASTRCPEYASRIQDSQASPKRSCCWSQRRRDPVVARDDLLLGWGDAWCATAVR